jgi:hypothetical protein
MLKLVNPGTQLLTLDAERGFLLELTNTWKRVYTFELLRFNIRAGLTGVIGSYQCMNLTMAPGEKKMIVVPIIRPLTSYIGHELICTFEMRSYSGYDESVNSYPRKAIVTWNDPAYAAYFSAPPPYVVPVDTVTSPELLTHIKEVEF